MSIRGSDSPSSIACLPCRTKHLKCDAQTPVCGRCAASATNCTFVGSRRGYRGWRRKRTTLGPVRETRQSIDTAEVTPDRVEIDSIPISSSFALSGEQQAQTEEAISMSPVRNPEFNHDWLIDIYYRDIHPAHPFILPRRMYLSNRSLFPVHLKTSMAYMASNLSSGNFNDLGEKAAEYVFNSNVPDDIFKVQSLLLLTLTSYARFERDLGKKALSQACKLVSRNGFDGMTSCEYDSFIHQESVRRTYWELYTITGLLSLITGINLRITCPEDLLLPGHCRDYEECRVSELRNFRTMGFRMSLEDGFKWSSFAYKIEATRILNSVLESGNQDCTIPDARVQALSASITGFFLSLPEIKQSPITDNGEMDEVMSCALMIINLAGICLHLPRSTLSSTKSFKTVCGNGNRVHLESTDERFHRTAAIRCANGLSKLISSRDSLTTLTSCFSCSIAYAAAVHLSAMLRHDNFEDQHKDHIQLELSALNVISRFWPIAGVVKDQIARYSRELLADCHSRGNQTGISSSVSSTILDVPNEWLDDLTCQYVDIPLVNDIFNFMDPLPGSSYPAM